MTNNYDFTKYQILEAISKSGALPLEVKDINPRTVASELGLLLGSGHIRFSDSSYELTALGKDYLEFCKKKLENIENKNTEYEEITKPMTLDDIQDILGKTIKHDNSNKIITFLDMLSAYTENNQFNISYRAPSSTGKSYIPLELSELFEDVITIGYASPTSFFHEQGIWDDDRKVLILDYERKILVFVDQPHDQLLQRLRPFLSHDQKEIPIKITDRREKYGLRTKTALLRGYASVIFCTGSLKIDEQEATRNFLLSPETTQEKIRESIILKANKKGNLITYNKWLESDEKRKMLKSRIKLIKEARINQVICENPEKIAERFINLHPDKLKPRHQRDIDRIISLIGAFALFNHWHRKKDENGNIYANQEDIDAGFKLWDSVSVCQELNIAPYVWRVFEEVIKPAYLEANSDDPQINIGITRKMIMKKFYEVYGRAIEDWRLRQEILPSMETAGLIYQEPNPKDKREVLIYIFTPHPSSLYPTPIPQSHSLYSFTPHPNSVSNNIVSAGVGGVTESKKDETDEINDTPDQTDAICEYCGDTAPCVKNSQGRYVCINCSTRE